MAVKRLAGLPTPLPHRPPRRRGDGRLATAADRRAIYSLFVACEDDFMACEEYGLASFRVPQPRRMIRGRSDDAFAIRTERYVIHFVRMTVERLADGVASFRVPQPCRMIRGRS